MSADVHAGIPIGHLDRIGGDEWLAAMSHAQIVDIQSSESGVLVLPVSGRKVDNHRRKSDQQAFVRTRGHDCTIECRETLKPTPASPF